MYFSFDGKCNFISELTDEQIPDIVDTSGDYEYDKAIEKLRKSE